ASPEPGSDAISLPATAKPLQTGHSMFTGLAIPAGSVALTRNAPELRRRNMRQFTLDPPENPVARQGGATGGRLAQCRSSYCRRQAGARPCLRLRPASLPWRCGHDAADPGGAGLAIKVSPLSRQSWLRTNTKVNVRVIGLNQQIL